MRRMTQGKLTFSCLGFCLAALVIAGTAGAATVEDSYTDTFSADFSRIDARISAPECVDPNAPFDLEVAGLGSGDVFITAFSLYQDTDWEYVYDTEEDRLLDRFPLVKINQLGTRIAAKPFLFGNAHEDTFPLSVQEPTKFTYIFSRRTGASRWYDVAVDLTVQPGAEARTIPVDIKPGSCPNPLNPRRAGVLPLAILGSDALQVSSIDVDSIRLAVNGNVLENLVPLRVSVEDVGTPHILTSRDRLDCTVAGPDGFEDLALKYANRELTLALEEALGRALVRAETLTISLRAEINTDHPDGNTCSNILEGEDVIWVTPRGK